ncbi:POGLUT2, partial [Symbiodinium necroappetens]
TGSVLLLQRSLTHEALHWELVEWHYVPVSASLDDLIELVTTLEGNETLAKQIAEAGADFYARRVRPEDAYCMALRTLEVSQLPEVTPQMLASRGFARAPGLEALPYTSAKSAPSTLRERIESHLEL